MGEVYRARDTRLNRDVALKVLPSEVAGDPSRRHRFEIEARAVAALNHPNIAAAYDVGAENGIAYFVSELVAGESLRGAKFCLRKTLEIATQIAAGLACAHEAGIIHRDLKPENILLSRDGRAKIVDFGLAKNVRAAAPLATETLTIRTEPGVVMGTVGYMSPEQVRGVGTDHRSDIFSFGLILYELLSGKRAFHGDTSVETMTAILKQDAPELPETVPAGVRQIVAHCLEKEPQNRFQSAKDLAFALSHSGSQTGGSPPIQTATGHRRLRLAAAAAVIAGVAAVTAHFIWLLPAPAVWSSLRLGGPDVSMTPRLSPDGHTLAFLAIVGRQSEVAIMKPDVGDWSVLTHHPERGSVTAVSWSPDGNKIYYDRILDVPHGVYSIPVLGGEEQLVLEDAMNPEALPDGSLLVARLNAEHQVQLYHFWPGSGRQQPLPLQISLTLFLSQVRAFPDGRQAVVIGSPVSQGLEGAKDLYVLDVASGRTRRAVTRNRPDQLRGQAVTQDGRSILFAEQGPYQIAALPRNGASQPRVLFPLTSMAWAIDTAQDGSLYSDQVSRPTSLVRFSIQGGHAVELGRVSVSDGNMQFAVLPDGRAIWEQRVAGRSRLAIVEEAKAPVPFSGTADETALPAAVIGPKEIAFTIGKDRRTIGIASIATGRITRRIAFDQGSLLSMLASPDGQTLYCNASRAIWVQPVSGGTPGRLHAGSAVAMDPAGKYLVVIDVQEGRTRLMKVPLGGGAEQEIPISGEARPYLGSTGGISKDGKLLIGLQAPDSWFLDPAVIDLATGRATRIAIDALGDNFSMDWTPDGQVMAAVTGLQSSLWKFQKEAR
jgi:Tol biopolymer transport system component